MERATDQLNIPKEARLSVELRIGTGGSRPLCDEARSDEITAEPVTSEKTSPMLAPQSFDVPIRPKDIPAQKHQGMTLPLQPSFGIPQAMG